VKFLSAVEQKPRAITEAIRVLQGIVARMIVGDDLTGPLKVPTYTVSTLPADTPAGQIIYVSDETGGAVLAFSDGSDWRRVTDRSVVA
jgi:hypothetical protein